MPKPWHPEDLEAWQDRLGLTQVEGARLAETPLSTYRHYIGRRRKIPKNFRLLCLYIERFGRIGPETYIEKARDMEYKQVRTEQNENEIERLNRVAYAKFIEENGLELPIGDGGEGSRFFSLEEVFAKKRWTRSLLWAAFIAGDSFSADFDANSTDYHVWGGFEEGKKARILFKEFVADGFDATAIASALLSNYAKIRKIVQSKSYDVFVENVEGNLEHKIQLENQYEDGEMEVRCGETSVYTFGNELTGNFKNLMGDCVIKAWRTEGKAKQSLDLREDIVFVLFSNGKIVTFKGGDIS